MSPVIMTSDKQNTFSLTKPKDIASTSTSLPDQEKLIDETIASIRDIYQTSSINVLTQIGELIFEKIYGSDLTCFNNDEESMEKSKNKWLIFQQLAVTATKMAKNGDIIPKKTFLYNAVRLVVDQKRLSNCPEYGNLSGSHRIELLPLVDLDTKLEATKEIQSKGLSVREARAYVSSLKKKKDKKRSINYYIRNPHEIKSETDFMEAIVSSHYSPEKKKDVLDNSEKKIAEIQALITNSEESITKLQLLMQRVNEVDTPSKKSRRRKQK